ncbi:MAG: hypothetical protein QF732_08225, partial [Nitrospinaceae bacterium]|nr:hypothetical protein [Nitrospinaceae bacterium]
TFYFADTTSTQTFYDDLRVIEIVVPYNTEITGLTPMIQHTGASIVPASGEVQNFTSSRKYAVTAENCQG